ncbi:MAG: hypothetical protein U5O15_10745 [Candidatus Krumholzibacteriota bacterium]|nr:hypothetical protein [Candidatus Krumholzibacteriota bacterium]
MQRILRLTVTWLLLGTTLLLGSACIGPDEEYRDYISTVSTVLLPDSTQAGSDIPLTIETTAPNGCWEKGHDDVQIVESGYLVIPYDRLDTASVVCLTVLMGFTHTVSLSTSEPGVHEIAIRHRLRSSTGVDSIATITREVVVY